MGKISELRPRAQSALLELEDGETKVEAFKAQGTFGFGVWVKTTRPGIDRFIGGAIALGLHVDLNSRRKLEHGISSYELFVEIPEDWVPPAGSDEE